MDLLQIALEHHRAGRLRQAEAGYRAIAEADPQNADAAHWLGVLSFQAGQGNEAIPLLERAVALRPTDPAFHHNLGQACLSCGKFNRAIEALEKAADLAPRHADTLAALGMARLSRRSTGDAPAAVAALRQARDAGLDSPELHHQLGIALLAADLPDEAIASFRAALVRNAELAPAYHHLALAYRFKGEPREVRKCLIKALELDRGLARAWYDLATLDADAGNLAVAVGLFRKAVAAKPDFSAGWLALGRALQQLDKREESARAFEQAARSSRKDRDSAVPADTPASQEKSPATAIADLERKITGSDAVGLHFALATRTNIFTPAQIPKSSLSDMFDRYSDYFDEQLRNTLQYRVPEMIAETVARYRRGQPTALPLAASQAGDALPANDMAASPVCDAASGSEMFAKPMDILDLGCGTGLCGMLLRPIAGRLSGVDISPGMIEKARGRGVYDHLEVGDLVDAMNHSPCSFDLLVSADVFIYVGDLVAVFEAAVNALRPGGIFVFSVEAGAGDRYNLNMTTRRYTHSATYLRRLAKMCGFEELSFEPIPVRIEAGQSVPGYLPVLLAPRSQV